MIKKISIFFVSIGIIAWLGPIFGFGVRGTDPADNTPEVGLTLLAIGFVFYLIDLGMKKN